jgi:choline kinase
VTTSAVILAAGSGTRLMPRTADRPKALVELGGRAILGRLLEACAAATIQHAVVVTGYYARAVEDWLAREDLPLAVDTVYNEAFARYGNAWSLWTAAERLAGRDFVKLDGDLLLDPVLLPRLIAAEAPSAILIDRDVTLDAEAMKATLEAGRVTALGKWLDVAASAGESIGVEKIAASDAPRLFETIERMVKSDGAGDAYYEDAYHRMVERGWQLGAVAVDGAAWTEIDDERDLERAAAMSALLA